VKESYEIKKVTECPWLNLYEVSYERPGMAGTWITCSRKEHPVRDAHRVDAVVIVPVLATESGDRLVVIREFRVPIWDYEYSFPAGLIEPDHSLEDMIRKELREETGLSLKAVRHISPLLYTSAGFTDEAVHMVLVEVEGSPSNAHLEEHEDIEVVLMDVADIRALLSSKNKIAAKAWGLLYHFAVLGEIRFSDFSTSPAAKRSSWTGHGSPRCSRESG
jgi:ADP-ribose pyrophosphatase